MNRYRTWDQIPTLLARYVCAGSRASSQVTGFHSFSLYTFAWLLTLTMEAKEDVMTTLFTVGA